jgi:hypothetical protein
MATFVQTIGPTPFSIFDADTQFQSEADQMVTFVKRKLGDDVLSVELTKKQIWANFEEAVLEFGMHVNQYSAKSQMLLLLGSPTGSLSGSENTFPRQTLETISRFAEPYASEAGIGGSFNMISGSIPLESGVQDYDIYDQMVDASGNNVFQNQPGTLKTKLRISEVFHFGPQAAYRFFDTTSAINYLNNEFSFESFTPETIFYVLPVFEDVLRAGMLDMSNRVRRSNYSYKVIGTKIRIYPMPTQLFPRSLFLRVRYFNDPLTPSYEDQTIRGGVSSLANVPFGNIQFSNINSIGKQWIRQYVLALSMEQLGMIRNKFGTLPVPGGNVTLNGADLLSKGREDKKDLVTKLREMLDTLTYDKLIETAALRSENLMKQLRHVPVINGKSIFMG